MTGPVFLDTTILVDATLGLHEKKRQTREVLARCGRKAFPQYAIKELKAGPLDSYVYFYDILNKGPTLEQIVGRLRTIAATPRKSHLNTVLQSFEWALHEASSSSVRKWRSHLMRLISSAWEEIFTLGEMTDPLECHSLSGPQKKKDGMIVLEENRCDERRCVLARRFHARKEELATLAQVVAAQPQKRENVKRLAAINKLLADQNLSDSECRHLGDAVFALLAPEGFVILTTNVGDHRPLAQALGRNAISPGEVT